MDQRPGDDLPARLHGAVQSVFLRWHDKMSFGPVRVQDFPEPWDDVERLDDDGPFWRGAPYCHLRHVWWRGRIVIPQDVDTLLAAAASLEEGDPEGEGHGSVYALWVAMADLRIDSHAAARWLVEVGRWIDLALYTRLSDEWYEG